MNDIESQIDHNMVNITNNIESCNIILPCKDCITLSICLSKYNIYFKNNSRMCSSNIDYITTKTYTRFSSKFYKVDKILEYAKKINTIENYHIIKYMTDVMAKKCSILSYILIKTLTSYNDIFSKNLNETEINIYRRIIIYKLIKNSLSEYLNMS